MVLDTFATVYITLFFRYISKDATTLIWIGFAINIVTCVLIFWIVESPSWLISQGRKVDAIKTLETIAKLNGVKHFDIKDLKEDEFEIVDN